MTVRYSELKRKDVLSLETGKNLGRINDLVIEEKNGKILKIVVPGRKNGFLGCENVEIDYSRITKIGDDVILIGKKLPAPTVQPCKPLPCANICGDFSQEDE